MGKLVTSDVGEKPDIESEVLNQIYQGLIKKHRTVGKIIRERQKLPK